MQLIYLYHPVNGVAEEVWEGFSWHNLLLGPIWLASKQLWIYFFISIIIIIITAGVGAIPVWIYCGFSGNAIYKKSLLRKGYLTRQQYQQRNNREEENNSFPNATGIADEISKLAELYNSGVLTEDEFNARKKKLLEN